MRSEAQGTEKFIQPTLESLSAQTWPNFTVLISVDVSEDATFDICKEHADQDPRFKVIKQTEKCLGFSGNCNFLLRLADADYVMFTPHDDLIMPDFSTKLAEQLDKYPTAIMAFPDTHLTNQNGSEEIWRFKKLEGVHSPLQRGAIMLKRPNHWWAPFRGMFRLKSAQWNCSLKPHHAGEFSVDWPWLFSLSLLGDFIRVPEILCYKRYMSDSLSRSWEFSKHQWFEVTASCMREIWLSPLPTEDKIQLNNLCMKMLNRRHQDLWMDSAPALVKHLLEKIKTVLKSLQRKLQI